MAFTVVYDACVLYPAPLRDLLMRLAVTGVVRARWTEDILDETFRNIAAKRPDVGADRLRRTRQMMCSAIDDCLVTGHEGLADQLDLPTGSICRTTGIGTSWPPQSAALRRRS